MYFPRVERRSVRPFERAELNRRYASGFNASWRFDYCFSRRLGGSICSFGFSSCPLWICFYFGSLGVLGGSIVVLVDFLAVQLLPRMRSISAVVERPGRMAMPCTAPRLRNSGL
jgi:hypothetical protein